MSQNCIKAKNEDMVYEIYHKSGLWPSEPDLLRVIVAMLKCENGNDVAMKFWSNVVLLTEIHWFLMVSTYSSR